MLNTRTLLLPLRVKRFAPGPLIVRFLLIDNSPLVRLIILFAGKEKLIVSPGDAAADALAMASRNVHLLAVHVPVPSSRMLFTVHVVAALLTGGRASISDRPTRLSPNSSDRVITRVLLTLIFLITVS